MITPTISLHYANSSLHPLENLQAEDEKVYERLSQAAYNSGFFLDRDSFSSQSKISTSISKFIDSLWLFHFSGHAGKDRLLVQDQKVRGEGIAHQLKQCKELVLVVLNGCSTLGQVNDILHQGLGHSEGGARIVIATTADVEDPKAKDFAIRFYDALSKQATIYEAFELAVGEILQSTSLPVFRGVNVEVEEEDLTKGTWGIYYHPDNISYLEQRLPVRENIIEEDFDYEPNIFLIEKLWELVKESKPELVSLESGEIPLVKIKPEIINNFTAPLGEPLRKLILSMAGEEATGYDQVSVERIVQCNYTYQVAIDLVLFIVMSQIWEMRSFINKSSELHFECKGFFRQSQKERESYSYIPFLRSARDFFLQFNEESLSKLSLEVPKAKLLYFRTILSEVKRFLEDNEFYDACTFMEIYRVRARTEQFLSHSSYHEKATICKNIEIHLSTIIEKLGIFSRYTLATIQVIMVQNYRTLSSTSYEHKIVELKNLLGKFQVMDIAFQEAYMDSKSVILINDIEKSNLIDEDGIGYMSFSPFVIDANIFDEKANLASIYFFHHFDRSKQAFYYYHVKNPKDKLLEIKDPASLSKESFIRQQMKKRKGPDYSQVWNQCKTFQDFFENTIN